MSTLEKAKLNKRILASLIDYSVVLSFFIMVTFVFGEQNGEGGRSLNGIKSLIPIGFWFIYLVVVESIFSASAGHIILGLKVTKTDGDRIDFIDSLKRHLTDPIDFLCFGVLAIILIKNTSLNQRLGDIWAKTIVVNDKE